MGMKPVRVGQLNNYIGRVLKTDPILGNVSVIGEISNLKFHNTGHVFFSLKDETGKVGCFLAASNLERISCPLDEGVEIIATGYISVYERGGYYSLHIKDIEVNGTGQLAAKFEKMKVKLEKEGLFDPSAKKELPVFPNKIAVVTSDTGAAVKDIIKTIKNKNSYVNIMVYPVRVQGPAAADEIVQAITDINDNYKDVDVIITGRGGGSMEELWTFNEEHVARCIYASKLPVISAVGHETDFTIADFVADVRAATPTAAAEIAVPDTNILKGHLDGIRDSITEDLVRRIDQYKKRLSFLDPNAFAQGISTKIAYEQMNVEYILESMTGNIKSRLAMGRSKTNMLRDFIESSNPDNILMKGYSIVSDVNGKIIKNTKSLARGQKINIKTGEGSAEAEVTGIISENERNEKNG